MEEQLVRLLYKRKETIATMESCTGGQLASDITNVLGASDVINFSSVTYSSEFKIKMGVSPNTIEKYTVYSIETAKEMSSAISNFAKSNYGVGITGNLDLDKKENKVYYSIYVKDKEEYFTDCLIIKSSSRKKMKKEVCESIIKKLIEIINY